LSFAEQLGQWKTQKDEGAKVKAQKDKAQKDRHFFADPANDLEVAVQGAKAMLANFSAAILT
jgi:hypothetical protein